MYNFDIKRLTPIIYVISVIILLFLVFKMMMFLLPFVISTAIVLLLKPMINKISINTKFSNKIIRTFTLLLFYIIVLAIIIFIGFRIGMQIYNAALSLVTSKDSILKDALNILDNIKLHVDIIPNSVENSIEEFAIRFFDNVSSKIISILNSRLSSSFNLLKSLPSLIIFLIFTFLSSFLIINEEEKIIEFIKKQIPTAWLKVAKEIKIDVFKLILNFIKAQIMLITLCFLELLIGFSIIKIFVYDINYVLLISVIIAIVDALPILGTGSVLIPWALISLISSNYALALSLVILYLTIFLVRQYVEPKLISNGTDMHPLVSLIAIYAGYKIFGIVGFLYGPIILTIIRIVFNEEIEYGFFKYLINEKGTHNEENIK